MVLARLVMSGVILGLGHRWCSRSLKQAEMVSVTVRGWPAVITMTIMFYVSDNDRLELDHLSLPLLFSSQLEVLGCLDGTLKQEKCKRR